MLRLLLSRVVHDVFFIQSHIILIFIFILNRLNWGFFYDLNWVVDSLAMQFTVVILKHLERHEWSMPLDIILLNHLWLGIVLVETLISAIQFTLLILIELILSHVGIFDVKLSICINDSFILWGEFKIIIEVHIVLHVAIVMPINIWFVRWCVLKSAAVEKGIFGVYILNFISFLRLNFSI